VDDTKERDNKEGVTREIYTRVCITREGVTGLADSKVTHGRSSQVWVTQVSHTKESVRSEGDI